MPHDDLASVARLYERLTEALQRTRRDPFNVPVTVAEIYQELVPYRLVRTEIGFDMNADYEHALLRLLAGEGEWVRIEPSHAADVIRRELRSANPNLSIYREYASCDVWVRKPLAPPQPRRSSESAFPSERGTHTRAVRPQDEVRMAARPGPPLKPVSPDATPATVPQAGRPPSESAAADARPLRSLPEPLGRQKPSEDRGSELAGEKLPLLELTDVLQGSEAPAVAEFGNLTLPGGDRAGDHERSHENERAGAMNAMSERSKREAASLPEPGGAAAANVPRAANPARSAVAPAAAASIARAAAPASESIARMAAPAADPARAGLQAAKSEATRCTFCDAQLPMQRQARFCPYCGADQTTRPCRACGEPLESGWVFCIACGASAQ